MPPEVLQQRQESTNQAIAQLREAEKICIEVVGAIATTWEQLINDETAEQLDKQARQEYLQVLAVKAEIKKLPTNEKITKGIELK